MGANDANNTDNYARQTNPDYIGSFGIVLNEPKIPFYQSDLDLDPITLIFDLDMVKISHHTKNEVSMSRHSKVVARTDTQRDRHYLPAYTCDNNG